MLYCARPVTTDRTAALLPPSSFWHTPPTNCQHAQVWTEKRAELLPRTDFVGGSFFEAATVPVARADSRDVYVLRVVLHDWSDAKTLEILANVRSAIGADLLPKP